MIYAYFIGGSLDLSKRALPDKFAPEFQYAYRPASPAVAMHPGEIWPDTTVECRKEVYRLLGKCYNRRDVFVYEYCGAA